MELYKEILSDALSQYLSGCTLPQTEAQLVESRCCNALKKIKAIIQDDSLDDRECFEKIEQIVCVFEEIGSSGGSRHDFG